jgi:hypothetical protein
MKIDDSVSFEVSTSTSWKILPIMTMSSYDSPSEIAKREKRATYVCGGTGITDVFYLVMFPDEFSGIVNHLIEFFETAFRIQIIVLFGGILSLRSICFLSTTKQSMMSKNSASRTHKPAQTASVQKIRRGLAPQLEYPPALPALRRSFLLHWQTQ